MSRPVARVGDFIFPHVCPTGEPHATPFVTGATKVLVNGSPCVTFGSFSFCGVMAIPTGSRVLVNGKPIGVMGSPTTKHLPKTIDPSTGKLAISVTKSSVPGAPEVTDVTFVDCFPPTFIATGSEDVLANTGGL
tara:strand:- start:426 stop:827 length:402 start_codon:yes stop_codon:yes gene_type:complete